MWPLLLASQRALIQFPSAKLSACVKDDGEREGECTQEGFIDVCSFEESGSSILGGGSSFTASKVDN